MKKLLLICLLFAINKNIVAQKQTYDLATFTPPKGWVKEAAESVIQLKKEDATKETYCIISLYKSVPATPNAKENFSLAWSSVVKQMVTVTAEAKMQKPETENGWETHSGYAPFEVEGNKGIVILVTASGFDKMVNLIILTNTDVYEKEMKTFLESISLKKITPVAKKIITTPAKPDKPITTALKDGFAFTTTNFDDGWTSAVQEDWVEVTKGNIKALLHFAYKRNTTSPDPEPVTNDAWNILVAPRYKNLKNYIVKYVGDYDRIQFATGYLTDNKSGKEVYVILISKNGGWIEFISPDKNTFVKAFGIDLDNIVYNSDKKIFEPLLRLTNCNKFAVAATDLKGKWSSSSSGVTQYYNIYSGDNAGMNINTAGRTFQFGANNTYQWDFVWVSGFSGAEKAVQEKYSGKFTMLNNWQFTFSNMNKRGTAESYDMYFTCIKGGRILWMNSVQSPGSGIYTGYGKVE